MSIDLQWSVVKIRCDVRCVWVHGDQPRAGVILRSALLWSPSPLGGCRLQTPKCLSIVTCGQQVQLMIVLHCPTLEWIEGKSLGPCLNEKSLILN